MEDSGYYSHKSGEFKIFPPSSAGSNNSTSSQNSYRRRLFSQELLSLDYQQLQNSEKFHHLADGFRDEQDFEEFKADLREFWKLKESTREEFIFDNELSDDEDVSAEHMLMEFFNSDENFQEFERVFDDFKQHRFYDFDLFKRLRGKGDPRVSDDEGDGPYDRHGNEVFSEFFDNDADFREFEHEFANFKVMQRRSRALDDFNRRSWCDLRGDINSHSDSKNARQTDDDLRHQQNTSQEDLRPGKGVYSDGAVRQEPREYVGEHSYVGHDSYGRKDARGCGEDYTYLYDDSLKHRNPRGSDEDYSYLANGSPSVRDTRGPTGDYSYSADDNASSRDLRGSSGDYSYLANEGQVTRDPREYHDRDCSYSTNQDHVTVMRQPRDSVDFIASTDTVYPEYEPTLNESLRSQSSGLSQDSSGNPGSPDSNYSYASDKQDNLSDSYSKYERKETARKPCASFKRHSCDISESSEHDSAKSEFKKSAATSRSQSYDFSRKQEEELTNRREKFSSDHVCDSYKSMKSSSEKDFQTRLNSDCEKHSYKLSNNSELTEENQQSNKSTARSMSHDFSNIFSSEQESRNTDRKSSSNLRSSRSYDFSEAGQNSNSSLDRKSSSATSRSQSYDFSGISEEELYDRISRNSTSQKSKKSDQEFRSQKSYDHSEQSQQNFSSRDHKKSCAASRSPSYDFSSQIYESEMHDRNKRCSKSRRSEQSSELSNRKSNRSGDVFREESIDEEASERCTNSSTASRHSCNLNSEQNLNTAENENLRRSYDFSEISDTGSSRKSSDDTCSSRNWSSGLELRITESNDDLFSEIYHGSTDFSKKRRPYSYDFLNYMLPGARSAPTLDDLPRKSAGQLPCDISDSDIGGTYPRLNSDRISKADSYSDHALKRRSAEYSQRSYSTDVAENLLARSSTENRTSRDYGQRRSNSDQSVYSLSKDEHSSNLNIPPQWSSNQDLDRWDYHRDFSPTRLREEFKPRPSSYDYGKCGRIRGLPKNDCQYTCHHRCRPLVTLDCTTVSGDDKEEKHDCDETSSEETSLSESTPLYNTCSCNNDGRQTKAEMVTPPSEGSHYEDTDSGYRSVTLQDEQSISESNSIQDLDEDSLKKEQLRKMIEIYNEASPNGLFSFIGDSKTFQGFIGCTLNLIRPITMSLGARPPSIYEVLTREHIVEQNTMSISFYMPRDTVKHIHVASDVTTKEVIASLLKKFKILDNPRKFAMYSQELKGCKIAKIRRVGDKEYPLQICLSWGCEDLKQNRLVLQENETGEIEWNAFSQPELQNFMRILDREEDECVAQLQYKYKVMKRIIQQRLKEIRKEWKEQAQAQRS